MQGWDVRFEHAAGTRPEPGRLISRIRHTHDQHFWSIVFSIRKSYVFDMRPTALGYAVVLFASLPGLRWVGGRSKGRVIHAV